MTAAPYSSISENLLPPALDLRRTTALYILNESIMLHNTVSSENEPFWYEE
uniref:Uncharacterized protein n=1 Tax=Anguilla anguilla TaxID=7936 RepID=A0A0E9SUE0_ANGAN